MFYKKSDDKTKLEVIDLKKLILLFLLVILALNITGCSNNIDTLDNSNYFTDTKAKCINKAWYKKSHVM
ncbi:hypothetical protein COK05_27650 [Bacillus cereus]|uniref:Uncharacterized protein n=1 Tax=Bacillus cereus TaxID=1396 RepID=A0A2B2LDW4_BACCE|nr:hypothetical protein COK05_27650 [Bacillus cereus]PGU13261.1 hypothetical protein COD21_02615 [Bacillus cereus]